MNLMGVLIGAVLGYMLGGPLGALLGAILGQSLSVGVSHTGWSGHDAVRAQQTFFTTTFSVLGHMAKADGHVSEHEIRTARLFMAQMNLNEEQTRAAMELFKQGKEPNFPLEQVLRRFRADVGGRYDLISMFLEIQIHAALADGEMHPAERQLFTRICGALGISEFQFRRLEQFIRAQRSFHTGAGTGAGGGAGGRQMPPAERADQLAAAYQTLGVDPKASDGDIKTAYRKLMKQHHPDKLVAKGLPPEMIKLAQERVQQINVAYDLIKSARNIK